MQAPPFWMWMFRIVGILCLISLLTPAFYILKYTLVDHPIEQKIARSTPATAGKLTLPANAGYTDLYIASAEGSSGVNLRILAVQRLGDLAANTRSLITYPVECFHAKLAIEQVASADPNPVIRAAAQSTLLNVAEHGAVINR